MSNQPKLLIKHDLQWQGQRPRMVRTTTQRTDMIVAVYSEAGLPEGIHRVRVRSGDVYAARVAGDHMETVAHV
jgi:hypothetical protein